MTPVMQSKLYARDAIHNGNCFTACLASLLDLPLWMVPPFEDMFGSRTGSSACIGSSSCAPKVHDAHALPEYYIASGLSARGVRHAVIYRAGELAHDPHPSRTGIVSVEWCWHLERVPES